MNDMHRIIPEGERPTREEMLPAAIAVCGALACIVITLSLVLAYGWTHGLKLP